MVPGLLAVLLLLTWGPAAAPGVHPGQFRHATESDFEAGEMEATVVSSLGDLELTAAAEDFQTLPPEVSLLYDLLPAGDGTMLYAAGPEGRLLKSGEQATRTVAETPGRQIFALAALGETPLVAVSGAKSEIARLEAGELKTLVTLPEVRYIWDLIVLDGIIYAATGTEGKVWRIDPSAENPAENPEARSILDAGQANILCLAGDATGRVYAGSDTDGFVYRLTPPEEAGGAWEAFVLYDAPEPEIGALLMREGVLYAGTADAEQARPGRLEKAQEEETGRPAAEEKPAEPEPEPDDPPEVPPAPDPVAPGEAAPGEAPEAEPETTPQPTPEQREALRRAVRQRLLAAREGRTFQAPAERIDPQQPQAPQAGRPTGSPRNRKQKSGNAVYRIGPRGLVTELFRESVMVLALAYHDGRLIVATGNEGQLYQVALDSGETARLADLDPQQIPVLHPVSDDALLLGTANPARLLRRGLALAESGTYTSPVLDAAQVSEWGSFVVEAEIPEKTQLTVQTRSGNVGDPEQEAFFSPWSEPHTFQPNPEAPLSPQAAPIASPPARFLQYRLRFTSHAEAGPSVRRVTSWYLNPNLPPRIESIRTRYPSDSRRQQGGGASQEEAKPDIQMNIEWQAEDPGGDALRYQLEARPLGAPRWLTIARDLDQNRYVWDTRKMPEGRYLLRITASDAPDNPGDTHRVSRRQSSPVLVDNTPPELAEAPEVSVRDGTVRVRLAARDAHAPLDWIRYMVNGEEPWYPVLPEDGIYDSTRETARFMIEDLEAGSHVITLRVSDRLGNTRLHNITVEIPADAG